MGHEGHDHDHEPHGHPHTPAADASVALHRAASPQKVKGYVITASDTRTPDDDTSGRFLREALAGRGHDVLGGEIVREEPLLLARALGQAKAAGADVVLVTGGTGITRRDGTFEALEQLLVRRLPGFGELFRMLSFQELGAAAMLTRATAGLTADGLVVFAMPGSTPACRLAFERLIGPELAHVVREARR